jgi:hypothetical protein
VAATKRPVDELRSIAAPHDLIEWVRKLPPDSATRSAWVDAPRADWVAYLAVLRGIPRDAILRAACECAIEAAGTIEGPEAKRVLDVLQAATTTGRDAFVTAEADLADLRLAIISHGDAPLKPPWMFWAELVLEFARASGRGNPLVGIALAMKMLATRGKRSARPAHTDLVARFRDKLTSLAG